MSDRRILVAGIGNVFFGDDGFGVEVARRLLERPRPDDVDVVDFGIRGRDLAYALLDGYAAAVLVDAMPRGCRPGTLSVIEPEIGRTNGTLVDAHGMDPATVLAFARTIGGPLPVLRLVGCEPAALSDDDGMAIGLSAPIAAAVAEAVELVESLIVELRDGVLHRA
jgi:hydrogenase maturation protease